MFDDDVVGSYGLFLYKCACGVCEVYVMRSGGLWCSSSAGLDWSEVTVAC